jgi:hypothetical protein
MTRMRNISRILVAAAAAIASTSCGDVVRTGRAPVFLVIDSLAAAKGDDDQKFSSFLLSDVITIVTTPAPCTTESPCPTIFNDPGQATLRLAPKDIGPVGAATPTTNNEVTITRVHVKYRRADGRNIQGVDVPYEIDSAATATVPATGTVTMGFQLVRHTSKEESPLVQLKTNSVIIATIAEVTLYGRDRVGNDISAMGTIEVDFGNFGDK